MKCLKFYPHVSVVAFLFLGLIAQALAVETKSHAMSLFMILLYLLAVYGMLHIAKHW